MTQQQLLDEYSSLPDEAQRQVADLIMHLQRRYKVTERSRKSSTKDFEDELFIGMWRNSEDLTDSTAWIRNNRKTEWGEGA